MLPVNRKISGYQKRQFGKFSKVVNAYYDGESKTKLYLKLNRKDNSSAYSKGKLLWLYCFMLIVM